MTMENIFAGWLLLQNGFTLFLRQGPIGASVIMPALAIAGHGQLTPWRHSLNQRFGVFNILGRWKIAKGAGLPASPFFAIDSVTSILSTRKWLSGCMPWRKSLVKACPHRPCHGSTM